MHFQENFVKLAELQRDLGGYEHLLSTDREFVREGCLQKLSRKGYQQRMFFLVSKIKKTRLPKVTFWNTEFEIKVIIQTRALCEKSI